MNELKKPIPTHAEYYEAVSNAVKLVGNELEKTDLVSLRLFEVKNDSRGGMPGVLVTVDFFVPLAQVGLSSVYSEIGVLPESLVKTDS